MSAGLVSLDSARVSAVETSRGATSPRSSSCPAVAATSARSSGSLNWWIRSNMWPRDVASGFTAA